MPFQYIVAIVRHDTLDAIEEAFHGLQVRGMTVSRVKGFGEYIDLWARNHLTEHLKIEVFVEAGKTDAVVTAILDSSRSDLPGAGIVAVLPVETFLHIRTRSATLPGEAPSAGSGAAP